MSTTLTWTELPPRQQHYLSVLFDLDQAKESQHQKSWYTAERVRPSIPAHEWRSITSQEFAAEVGKIPRGERWESIMEALEQLELIEIEREGQRLTRYWLTKVGRRVVRQGLNVPTKSPRALTENQERYAQRIANAGLAPLEEVRVAFLDQTKEAQSTIKAWGAQLSQRDRERRKEAERDYIEEHTRYEICAVPGCGKKMKVIETTRHDLVPAPALTVMASSEAPGWHAVYNETLGKRISLPNHKNYFFNFFGCSTAHNEAIARMGIQVTLTPNTEAEHTLASVQYAVGLSLEARFAVGNLGRQRAIDFVGQMPPEQAVPTDQKSIDAEMKRQIALLKAEVEQDGKELTDDFTRFRRLYRTSFRDGWQYAVQKRHP